MEKKEFREIISSIPWHVLAKIGKASRCRVLDWKKGRRLPSGEKMLNLLPLIIERKGVEKRHE